MARGDSGSFQDLLAQNWEKIVLSLTALACVGLVALSLRGGEQADVTPDSLVTLASQAQNNIRNTEPEPTREVRPYSRVASEIRVDVAEGAYTLAKPFDPPVFEPKKKREEPPVFPVVDLRGKGGHSAVPKPRTASTTTGPGGSGYPGSPSPSGSEGYPSEYPGSSSSEYGYSGTGARAGSTEGVRYIVVTGLIEWEKQLKAYRDTFQDAIQVGGTGTSGYSGYGSTGYPSSGTSGYSSYGSGSSDYDTSYGSSSEGYGSGYGSSYGSTGYPGSSTSRMAAGEMPQYVYAAVERALVTDPNASADELQWERLNTRQLAFEERQYGGTSSYGMSFSYGSSSSSSSYGSYGSQGGNVPREYLVPDGQVPITWPLRRLVDSAWGPEVAHEPEIPFLEPRQMGAYGGYGGMSGSPGSMPPGATGTTRPPAESEGAEEGETAPAQPAMPEIPEGPMIDTGPRRGGPGSTSYGPTPYGASGTYTGSPTYGSSYGSESGYGYGASTTSGYPSGSGYGSQYGTRRMAPRQVSHKLYRFVDYNVEPGERYRYRVKLYLANPNYGLDPRYLADESLAENPFLETEWSDASPAIAVPFDASILAGSAKEGNIPYSGPKATLGVTVFQFETGQTAFSEFPDLDRGTVVNFTAEEAEKLKPKERTERRDQRTPTPYGSPGGSTPYGAYGGGEEGYGAYGGDTAYGSGASPSPYGRRAEEEEEEVDYFTDMVLLDVRGGYPTPTKETAPGEVLVLDPDGNLQVRNQVEDKEDYERYKEADQPRSPYGGYGSYGEYPPSSSGEGYGSYGTGEMPYGERPTNQRRRPRR